jgi:hypothetical protein
MTVIPHLVDVMSQVASVGTHNTTTTFSGEKRVSKGRQVTVMGEKMSFKPGVVVHACNPSTQELDVGES